MTLTWMKRLGLPVLLLALAGTALGACHRHFGHGGHGHHGKHPHR